jgi:DNA repair exonuclease SbcCD ATPase subunit
MNDLNGTLVSAYRGLAMGENQEKRETFGASKTQMEFAQVLNLLNAKSDEIRHVKQEIQADIKDIRGRLDTLSERLSSKVSELYTYTNNEVRPLDARVDSLEARIRGLESDKESFVIQIRDLKSRMDRLESTRDEFSDIPFYFRPNWIKAFGLAIAAVIAALAASVLVAMSSGPQKGPSSDNAPIPVHSP